MYSIQTSSCSLTKQALDVLKYILAVLSPFARQGFWLIQLHFLLKDKRIARQYGCSVRGTPPVVSDYGYSQWEPHYSVIWAISNEGVLASCVLKNPHERDSTGTRLVSFSTNSFSQTWTIQWGKPAFCCCYGWALYNNLTKYWPVPQRTLDLHFSFMTINRK